MTDPVEVKAEVLAELHAQAATARTIWEAMIAATVWTITAADEPQPQPGWHTRAEVRETKGNL